MNMTDWLLTLPQYLILFPAAASCYLPMKNQLKYPPARTAGLCLALLAVFCPAAAWLQVWLGLSANALLFPAMAAFFLLYRLTVKADLSRVLAVYVGVCAIETFPCQLANAVDAYRHPDTWAVRFSPEAVCWQMGMSLAMLAAAWTIRRHIVRAIDRLDFPRVWYATVPLSGIFLCVNAAAMPDSPELYYVGQPYHFFLLLEACALALLVCAYALFYQGAWMIWERSQLAQRSQLLEIQSHQYMALQEHMRQTARLRHDFRHSVRLLSTLAEQGDLGGVRGHLAEYERELAEGAAVSYCGNATLNALLGYYHEMAASAGVETDWDIRLPEPLTVSELDLASLFGNLIENAVKGCQTLPEGRRYFSLTAETRQGDSLYIVSTNSFDGRVIKGPEGYCSTSHSGRGIGLTSIAAVAEKYGGAARFSNSDTEFFADVVIRV